MLAGPGRARAGQAGRAGPGRTRGRAASPGRRGRAGARQSPSGAAGGAGSGAAAAAAALGAGQMRCAAKGAGRTGHAAPSPDPARAGGRGRPRGGPAGGRPAGSSPRRPARIKPRARPRVPAPAEAAAPGPRSAGSPGPRGRERPRIPMRAGAGAGARSHPTLPCAGPGRGNALPERSASRCLQVARFRTGDPPLPEPRRSPISLGRGEIAPGPPVPPRFQRVRIPPFPRRSESRPPSPQWPLNRI